MQFSQELKKKNQIIYLKTSNFQTYNLKNPPKIEEN